MDAIAEPPALTFSAWTRTAVDCLREHWPATDPRQLQGIAVELFSDPDSGVLPPRDAVDHWMRHLAPGAPGDVLRP